MELALFVYFAEMLLPLTITLFVFVFLGIFVGLLTFLFSQDGDYKEINPKLLKVSKFSLCVSLVCLILFVITPTTKTAYTMAGAYAAQKLVQSEAANEVGQKVYKIVNQKLDSYIVEETKKVAK